MTFFFAWIFFKLQIDNLRTFSNKKLMNVVYSKFFFEFNVLEKRKFLIKITEHYKKFICNRSIKVIIDFDNRTACFLIAGTTKLKKISWILFKNFHSSSPNYKLRQFFEFQQISAITLTNFDKNFIKLK